MPIYAYRCTACGHARDVLQKMSDAQLVECPACHAESFEKQLTAAGFQLKGSGWYATDFRNGQAASGKTDADAAKPETAPGKPGEAAATGGGDAAKTEAPAATASPKPATPAGAAAPSGA